jgi:hypothetical protein
MPDVAISPQNAPRSRPNPSSPAATKARSFVVGPPIAAQKLVIPIVAAVGRARGNRPVLPQPVVSVSSSVSPSPSSSSS